LAVDTSIQKSPKLRLLRVFGVIGTALLYCAQNAGRLFAVAWLACLLESATRLGLEWLVLSYPPKLPDILLSDVFNPPTWLTALASAPWLAMALAFVLRDMADKDPGRIVSARILRRARLRFELTGPILIAATIIAVDNLFDGASRVVERQLLISVYLLGYQMSDSALIIWELLSEVIRIAVVGAVSIWLSVIAGHALLHETLNIGAAWRLMRSNRLRLAAISFVLNIALLQLYAITNAARAWLMGSITDPASWSMTEAMLRYALDFPIAVFWIVWWAVTIGIVLDALEPRTASIFD
jgi:hypothetical protein